MLKDKSRILLFGALILLVLVLMDGGTHIFGFGLFHHASWLRWLLMGLLVWLVLSRCGCCGSHSSRDEMEEMDLEAMDSEAVDSEAVDNEEDE
ncbi:MAG: hypothetical protein HKN13_08070 [Rhodothermales bacterium]|nr:hypothetical protein [Rhodothermales bacterium]